MKNLQGLIGMILVIAGGVAGYWFALVNTPGTDGNIGAVAVGFIVGATIPYFILKKFSPDLIDDRSEKIKNGHWILIVIITILIAFALM